MFQEASRILILKIESTCLDSREKRSTAKLRKKGLKKNTKKNARNDRNDERVASDEALVFIGIVLC